MGTNKSYFVHATETSFAVIEALRHDDGAGVTTLAERTSYSKSAVHKHLQTLVELGYVVKQDTSYRLSLKFLTVSHAVRGYRMAEFGDVEKEIDKLARSTGLIARLVVPERDHGTVLYQTCENADLRPNCSVDESRRLDRTAAGLAMLARMPNQYVVDFLERVEAEETTPPVKMADFHGRLRSIRERGIAYVEFPGKADWQTAAAPIIDDGSTVGAVSVTGPIDQTIGLRLTEDVTNLVVSAAESLAEG